MFEMLIRFANIAPFGDEMEYKTLTTTKEGHRAARKLASLLGTSDGTSYTLTETVTRVLRERLEAERHKIKNSS